MLWLEPVTLLFNVVIPPISLPIDPTFSAFHLDQSAPLNTGLILESQLSLLPVFPFHISNNTQLTVDAPVTFGLSAYAFADLTPNHTD